MGKDSDKLYITQAEWTNLDFGAGGFKARKTGREFKKLPFWCCALSLSPFDEPRATKDGHVFDLVHIVPWIKKHGTNPVSGQPLAAKDLIQLHFHRNAEGHFHDPITFKVFTESTHIVAVATTGHVYAYETIDELCAKPKSWRDLMTDEPFKRKDLITIQDPLNVTGRDINAFHYNVNELEKPKLTNDPAAARKLEIESTINAKGTTARILAAMAPKSSALASSSKDSPITPSFVAKEKLSYNTAHYSDNSAAASFTSLGATPVTRNKAAVISDDEYLVANVKDRASAKIHTNFGILEVELFCDVAPKACYNFVQLSKNGYYKNVPFHRSIKNFMIQTGDSTGTGKGGESYYGHSFSDEFRNLSHDSRGLLSMANRGKNTNSSQFFITFKQCKHLDGKHSIFGKVVSGLDVLDRMENVETDDGDKPKKPITMESIEILLDPFEKALKILHGKDQDTLVKQQEAVARKAKKEANDKIFEPKSGGSVGKYLNNSGGGSDKGNEKKRVGGEDGSGWMNYDFAERPAKKKSSKGGSSGFDFSSW